MIEWTEQAAGQLDHALDAGEDIALRVNLIVVKTLERLTVFPMSGRAGRIAGTRELVIPDTPFIAAYAVEHQRIVILALYHGARRWPDTL